MQVLGIKTLSKPLPNFYPASPSLSTEHKLSRKRQLIPPLTPTKQFIFFDIASAGGIRIAVLMQGTILWGSGDSWEHPIDICRRRIPTNLLLPASAPPSVILVGYQSMASNLVALTVQVHLQCCFIDLNFLY